VHDGVATRLAPLLGRILMGSGLAAPDELPIRVIAWDGSSVGPATAPAFVIRHRRALRRLLWKPGEMGLVRAYVAGELDIEGDIFAALGAVQRVMRHGDEPIRLNSDDKREIVRTAVTLGAVGPEPKPPAEEFPVGPAGTPAPLDQSPEFAARVLGPGMADTCASRPADGLETAQRAAYARVASRLALSPGMRLLDLSCGWGAFARYAAAEHGVRVVGLTQSRTQAEYARSWMAADGLAESVDIRLGDHTAAGDDPFDAIAGLSAIGRLEVFAPDAPATGWHRLLVPGGTLLVQQMVRRPGPHATRRTFTTSYVLPQDGEVRALGDIVNILEADLEVREVTALREDYAQTLRAWATALQNHWTECAALASPGRARVWLLYLAASALACDSGRVGFSEICAIRRNSEESTTASFMPGTAVLSG